MHPVRFFLIVILGLISFQSTAAPLCLDNSCCGGQAGGISYCDSSNGRFVCNNGDYSTCYCTRHAVMDLQQLMGCCMWQGGIRQVNGLGVVMCNDGAISEICSLQNPTEKIVSW